MPLVIGAATTVGELLACRPAAIRVFLDLNLACVGCTMARFDTRADVARAYDIGLEQLITEVTEATDADTRRDGSPPEFGRGCSKLQEGR